MAINLLYLEVCQTKLTTHFTFVYLQTRFTAQLPLFFRGHGPVMTEDDSSRLIFTRQDSPKAWSQDFHGNLRMR